MNLFKVQNLCVLCVFFLIILNFSYFLGKLVYTSKNLVGLDIQFYFSRIFSTLMNKILKQSIINKPYSQNKVWKSFELGQNYRFSPKREDYGIMSDIKAWESQFFCF